MFTGIVQGTARVTALTQRHGLLSFTVALPAHVAKNIKKGASLAIDGVCLTSTRVTAHSVSFDVMQETLNKTTLGTLTKGSRVNVERSLRMGDEIGGHILSGHVMGTAGIIDVQTPPSNHIVTFRMPDAWMPYILPKGFIALDGVSLTIVDVDKKKSTFTAHLIPETLRRTSFGWKQTGDLVNVELDSRTQAIVDTVTAYMQQHH